MSLQPGQIISQDISPNAQILGTQIADNTIQLRNLADSTFKIIYVNTITVGAVAPGGVNNNAMSTGIPAKVGAINASLSFVVDGGGSSTAAPFYSPGSMATVVGTYVNAGVLWYSAAVFDESGTGVIATTFKYYILQEKAN